MHELDRKLIRRDSQRIAADFNDHDFFCAEVQNRLLERLNLITLLPDTILELGCGTGRSRAALNTLWPEAQVVELDWSEAMLETAGGPNKVCADAQQLPLRDGSADLVFSNLMLRLCTDPERVFAETRRILKHPGLLLFTTLGPDTLKQLKRAWKTVDDYPHVHTFADMHNVGDALVQAGFREPVMDVEHITITYGDADKLFTDLRTAGATNRLINRRPGLTSRGAWQRMLAALDSRRNADDRLEISLELITGQAWTGEAARGVQMHDGEAAFPLDRLRP